MNEADKIEAKLKKKQDAKYLKTFRQVVVKLQKSNMPKKVRHELIQDLRKLDNIDVLTYLALSKATFKDKDTYFSVVNAWIEHEGITYEYNLPQYDGTNFSFISDMVRLRHQFLDLKKKIFINT